MLWQFIKFVRKYACCTNPLPDLAYANVFAQKSQPFGWAWALIRQGRICTAVLLFDIWSKYDNFAYLIMYFGFVYKFARYVYFLCKFKILYANKLLKHMSYVTKMICPS